MRITDDRYARDIHRIDLALRLIRLKARTHTIHQWTGLSDDRIRKLYKSYCAEAPTADLARHRGKSPRQAAFFFRNAECHFHAAQLASLYLVYGLTSWSNEGVGAAYRHGSLAAGATLCSAYETYRQLHQPTMISFEHAWFLLLALSRRAEIGMEKCGCGGVRLTDLLARRSAVCSTCGASALACAAAAGRSRAVMARPADAVRGAAVLRGGER
jgi:Flagellar transcriptional activator (FlhC)